MVNSNAGSVISLILNANVCIEFVLCFIVKCRNELFVFSREGVFFFFGNYSEYFFYLEQYTPRRCVYLCMRTLSHRTRGEIWANGNKVTERSKKWSAGLCIT